MVRTSVPDKRLLLIPVSDILPNPLQPRRIFDAYEMSVLSESIKHNGILQPLTVRKAGNAYELIAGERRLKAAVMAGLSKVPCILQRADREEAAIFTIIENLQRCDLGIFEEAEGIQKLMDCCGLTRCEVAEQLGIAQSTLSNKLRLLKLTPEEQQRITAARLTERHARALLRLEGNARAEALDSILAKGLTVTEAEEYIENLISPEERKEPPKRKSAIGDVRLFANSLDRIVKTMVRSGVRAKTERNETDEYIEYTVRITKQDDKSTQMRLISL